MFEDIKLSINSEATTQRETPHGVLRTLFVLPQANQDTANHSQLQLRYDEARLVFALTTGQYAEQLAEKTITFLWDQFPAPDATMRQFADAAQTFLTTEARTVADDDSRHAIVMGALSREVSSGRGWLAWLGTSGLFILDRNNEPMTLETGLTLGEGWSPKKGIMPESARVHTDVIMTNMISRLLVFTNVLRPIITEVPALGRAAIQRIATTQAQQLAAVLLDLKTYPVVKVPQNLSLFYRWEDATRATLFWMGSEDATGYRVEKATMPSFEDVVLLAELSDSRQRIYTIQPPVDHEVFYRVIPMAGEVPGKPSNTAVVTPVPLVAPVVESINWLANGGLRITWTNVIQANAYELESSPDADFDSPETAIIYRGSTPMYETTSAVPNGWYYRVRSLNTHFAPRSPSFWSQTRRAPIQLDIPQFVNISQSALTWSPILGAKSYEVRRFSGKDAEGHSTEQRVTAVEDTTFALADTEPAVYQVRAVREIGDEFSASGWSYPSTIGSWEGDLSVATLLDNAEPSSQTVEVPRPMRPKVAVEPMTTTVETQPPAPTAWSMLLIAAAGALGIGLMLGLIGGPRFGIGLDPTNTPLNSGDRMATQSQGTALWVNATERANLSDQLNQSEALGTEQSLSATAEFERLNLLSGTATADSITADGLSTQVVDYLATTTAGAGQIENMLNINEALIVERDELLAIGTAEAGLNATYRADIDSLNITIAGNLATIAVVQNVLATTESRLGSVSASATAQAQAVETLAAQYNATSTALALTPTPYPGIFGKQD